MDKYTRNAVNYAISHYKLGLLHEIQELQAKSKSVETSRALYEVIKIMANDVVEEKDEEKNWLN